MLSFFDCANAVVVAVASAKAQMEEIRTRGMSISLRGGCSQDRERGKKKAV